MRAEGVLNKSVSDSSLEKINDARLDQSMFGRIFGFGTLDILTAAEEAGGQQPRRLPDDRRPGRVQEGDVRPEADARAARPGPAALPAGRGAAGDASRGADAAASRIRSRRGPRRRGGGARARRRTDRHRLPPRMPPTTSPPRSSGWPDCATRGSSRPRSTRPRSATCWSGCRWAMAAPAHVSGRGLRRGARSAHLRGNRGDPRATSPPNRRSPATARGRPRLRPRRRRRAARPGASAAARATATSRTCPVPPSRATRVSWWPARWRGTPAIFLLGRAHPYEGHSQREATLLLRAVLALGVETVRAHQRGRRPQPRLRSRRRDADRRPHQPVRRQPAGRPEPRPLRRRAFRR